MTEKDQRLIDELKHNIQRLIISLDKTKEELQKSRENFFGLQEENVNLRNENEALKKKVEMIKVARAFAGGDPENQAAKQKVTKLIREVDKCIAMLNQ
jgi:regulator of replication initiation timing